MSLSTTYTKTETDFLIQQLEIKTSSGYQGDLLKTDVAPTTKGFYALLETGIYPNLGNINAEAGKLNFASFDGTTWSKVEVALPNTTENVFNPLDDVNPSTMKATSIYLNSQLTTTITSKNLFDKSTILQDKYINTSNGTLSDSVGFWTSDFIQIDSNKDYYVNQGFTFIAFYDIDKIFISGIGVAGQHLINPPTNASYLRFSDNNNSDLFQLEEGNSATNYEEFYEYEIPKFEEKYVVIEKKIVTDGVNYNLIRTMVKSITDASETKRYRIIVPKGEWHESDLSGKPYVEIVGEDLFDTVIWNDGLSTKLTPSDYSTPSESNKPLNQVPQHLKHVVYVTEDTNISNLTIDARGNIKYCAHIDATTYEEVNMKVRFVRSAEEVNNCVGIGLKPNQKINLDGSVFIRTDNQPAIFVHNSPDQSAGSELNLDNTFYQGCSYVLVGEMGSQHGDWIYLRNADANITSNKFITVICEVDPVSLPYNFRMNIVGTKVNSIVQLPYQGNNNPRPRFAGYIIGNIG